MFNIDWRPFLETILLLACLTALTFPNDLLENSANEKPKLTLTVPSALELQAQHDPAIAKHLLELQRARLDVILANRVFTPQYSLVYAPLLETSPLTLTYTLITYSGISYELSFEPSNKNLNIFFTVPINRLDGLEYRYELLASKLSLQMAFSDYRELLIERHLALIDAMLDYWQALKRLENAESTLERAEQVLEVTKLKLQLGLVAKPDLLRAQMTYNNLLEYKRSVQSALYSARESLLRTIGLTDEFEVELELEPEKLSKLITLKVDFSYDNLVKLADDNSPELRKWYYKYELAKLEKELVYQRETDPIDLMIGANIPRQGNSTWNFTLRYRYSSGKYHKTAIEIQELKLRELLIERDNLKLDICESIRKQLNSIESLTDNLKLASENLNIAKQHYKLIVESYKEGLCSSLEVSQATTELRQAEDNLIELRANLLRHQLQVLSTVGIDIADLIEE